MPHVTHYLLLLLTLIACNLPPPPTASVPRRAGEGTLALFLNGPSKAPFSMTIDLTSLEAVREDGSRFPILPQARTVDSLKALQRQVLLTEAFLPPGRYREIHARVAKAKLNRSGDSVDLSVAAEGFTFNV